MPESLSTGGRDSGFVRSANPRAVALIVASAMFMEQLDGTVLATALPTMAHAFGVDPLHMSVALTSYLLSLAVLIPASGTMADRFGSRTVFRAAIAVFVVGSILCAQSPNLACLVLARILQGVGGAMMMPVGRLVLLRSAPKSELVRTMAWLMIPATLGPILGPPVGGFITTYLDWRWIFYVNVPIGLLGMALATRFIPQIREPERIPFDLRGIVISGVALVCLMSGLEMVGRGVGAPAAAACLLAGGAAAGLLYIRHARRHAHPVLDFRLMRVPTFRQSVVSGTLSRIAVGAMPFLLPMMLQLGFGMSAAHSGVVTFVSAAGSMAMRGTAPWFLRTLGFRNVLVWVGFAAVLLMACCAAFRPWWPMITIYVILFAQGFMQSLQFMAYNTVAYADIPAARMSAATSFYTTFQQLSLSLGIAAAATALATTVRLSGHAQPLLSDFSLAFLAVAAVSVLAPLVSLGLEPSAGAQMSGYSGRGPRPAPAE